MQSFRENRLKLLRVQRVDTERDRQHYDFIHMCVYIYIYILCICTYILHMCIRICIYRPTYIIYKTSSIPYDIKETKITEVLRKAYRSINIFHGYVPGHKSM